MRELPNLDRSQFTQDQVDDIERYVMGTLHWFAEQIDEWMYTEVLPKTINVDDEYYGNDGIITRSKLSAK